MDLVKQETALGKFFVPADLLRDGDTLVDDICKERLDDWRVAEAIMRYWRPDTGILDVGMNLGHLAVCVAKALRSLHMALSESGVRLYGVEARAILADAARKNLALNDVSGTVVAAAAWSTSGVSVPLRDVDLSVYASAGSFGLMPGETKSVQDVPTVAIDDMNFELPVSVIKLDIQGAELDALRGAEGFLESHRPTVIFEFEEMFAPNFAYTFHDLLEVLRSHRYQVREVVGSNNYVAVAMEVFESLYAASFPQHRRRRPEREFFRLVEGKPS